MGGQKDRVAGRAKEVAGRVTGDPKKETEGKVQHAAGRLEQRAKDAGDTATGAARVAKDKLAGR